MRRLTWATLAAALLLGACSDTGGNGDGGPCSPSCANKVCGSNGCGGVCGNCKQSEVCTSGICLPMIKDCGNKQCEGAESCYNCPGDCGKCCGNKKCEMHYGENCRTCAADCACVKPKICNSAGICVAGSDGGNPLSDQGKPNLDQGQQTCQPNQYFCSGSQQRRCNTAGNGSIWVYDCKFHNFASISYACVKCPTAPTTGLACESNKVLFSGSGSGLVSFTYQYHPHCKTMTAQLNQILTSVTLMHQLNPNGMSKDPLIQISISDLTKIPSGKQFPLIPDLGKTSPILVSVTWSSKPLKACANSGLSGAPSKGTITVTYSGTAKGSNLSIKVDGYLSCTASGASKWEKFSYTASGVVF